MKANPIDEAKELQQMLVQYAKQETIEPLYSLAKYVGYGVLGAFLIFLGVTFTGMGTLRLLQGETGDTFDGRSFLSILPYLGALAVMGLIVVFLLLAMKKATREVR